MDWEDNLLSVPTDQWRTDQVIVLDWYDGPRAGVCALANPAAEFFFDCVDEKHNPDGLDLRIVRLKELPIGSVAALAGELARLGLTARASPVWVPVWRFPMEEDRRRADAMVQAAASRARSTGLLLATPDMVHFANCWRSNVSLETPR